MKHFLLFSFFATLAVHADLIIVEEMMLNGKVSNRRTTSLRSDKVRIDHGDRQSDILDLKSSEFVGLIHQHKLYSHIGGKDYSSQIARAQDESPIPEAKATGKTEIIDGNECEIFTHNVSGVSTRLWVAKAHPLYAKYKAALLEMRALNREPFIYGIVLKSESKMEGITESTRITSLKQNKVPDSISHVHAGYKKQ
jgi:hypothetical protein